MVVQDVLRRQGDVLDRTFWIGFEMIQDPYAIVRSTGSVIGEVLNNERTMVCSFLLHLDYMERPM